MTKNTNVNGQEAPKDRLQAFFYPKHEFSTHLQQLPEKGKF